MLMTLVTIAAMFTFILATHNYVLEAIHRDASSEPKSQDKIAD